MRIKNKICVFDFDNTVYDGNVTLDFFKFSLKRHFLRGIFLPIIGAYYILLRHGLIDLSKFIEVSYKYLVNINTFKTDLDKFWEKHFAKIKVLYFKRKGSTNIIVSASPDVFIEPIISKLDCKLIASHFDVDTGKVVGQLCYGLEKVVRLVKEGINSFDEFYTDDYSDSPLIKMAKFAYLVRGNSAQLVWKK
jgi:phosphoserine phosphatase